MFVFVTIRLARAWTAPSRYPRLSSRFYRVTADFDPAGDQPAAIAQLLDDLQNTQQPALLQGVTGSGKTLVLAHVLAQTQPLQTLLLSPTKVLAAQLTRELRHFLDIPVHLFVSSFLHYRPEYCNDTQYRAKKSKTCPDLEALRHQATRTLWSREPCVIVSSVSCLYGLGLPQTYGEASIQLQVGDGWIWEEWMEYLLDTLLYRVASSVLDDLERGEFQVYERDSVRHMVVWPPDQVYPSELEFCAHNDDAWKLTRIRQGNINGMKEVDHLHLFPARLHGASKAYLQVAMENIREELDERVEYFKRTDQADKAVRLQERTLNDLYLMQEMGYCPGIENYSRHLDGRQPGEAPVTLLDYFGSDDTLVLVDESHVTIPQLQTMGAANTKRKEHLIAAGYRLPSAMDHRPLTAQEFWSKLEHHPKLFVSATPGKYEREISQPPVPMTIRPTYVCDPSMEVRPADAQQLDDLLLQVQQRVDKKERVLVIALTKRDSEDLASFFHNHDIASTYLHSGLDTMKRSQALRQLQTGDIDVLVGVNCLREGLDLPQVSLVAVLHADSEGFLRSESALLQVVGRAARHKNGHAIFYANRITKSMKACLDLTEKRRAMQLAYNEEHGLEMRTTTGSSIQSLFELLQESIEREKEATLFDTDRNETTPVSALDRLEKTSTTVLRQEDKSASIETSHIPSSPGVYFWKDKDGKILYIGKAIKLRSRVRSYLTPKASHGARIQRMIELAHSVDIVLTPSERDALVLESNLIKHHKPPFNVLMKDDEHYPYICASIGDALPRLSIVSQKSNDDSQRDRYRYFGPYTNYVEINKVMDEIESKYDLRSKLFLTRHGSLGKDEYKEVFQKVLDEAFQSSKLNEGAELRRMREEYEEGGKLFDAVENSSRDVVYACGIDETETLVTVIQLRSGVIAGRFSYRCKVPAGHGEDYTSAVEKILSEKHYPSGESPSQYSWFPDSVLLSHCPNDVTAIKNTLRESRKRAEPCRKGTISVRGAFKRGDKRVVDERTLHFAQQNVKDELSTQEHYLPWKDSGIELADMLDLQEPPSRIECYDISHTQGDFPVGSRVVFVEGKPAPHLYRRFNIKTVDGVDDYASLEEVLERRFRRAQTDDDSWSPPDLVVIDGGKGQLSAALKGISKATGQETVPICALAKDQEQVFVVGQADPVNDQPNTPALLLLRALRDESHRFALKNHRNRRSVVNQLDRS